MNKHTERQARKGDRKQPGAAPTRDPALAMLHEHHERISDLLRALKSQGPERGRETLREAARLLTLHGALEEELFYPTIQRRGSEDLIGEAFEEHLDMKERLHTLLTEESPDAEAFTESVDELTNIIEDHVEREEAEIFAQAEQALSEEERRDLATAMNEAAADLEQELAAEGQPELRLAEDLDAERDEELDAEPEEEEKDTRPS